jgi:hypothetical protein
VLQERPGPNRTDAFNQIEGNECFARIQDKIRKLRGVAGKSKRLSTKID